MRTVEQNGTKPDAVTEVLIRWLLERENDGNVPQLGPVVA
jgi:hypothetical protein